MSGRIRLGADVGGTFTDVVLATDGGLVTAKVPSTDEQSVGVLNGVRKACSEAGIDPADVGEFTHAMTVSVNALLERAGAKTALVTTEGFRDVLELGRQDRPDLYDLDAERPEPLVPRRRRFEIAERTTPAGVEDAVDAYVTPKIDRYLGQLARRAADAEVPKPLVMQSNGGVADVETVRRHAVTTAMSGPAAGVVGASAAAGGLTDERDLEGLVTFDMGGTSSDVSLVRDGEAERTTDAEIDGLPVRTPMVDVTTVGAGGGSVAWVDAGGALRVGPRSAGADPGPACYGNGGTEPTVTDANLVLGYIGEDTRLGGELALDAGAAHDALAALADEAGLSSPVAAARGVYRVANATMARAIRSATVERGHDPRAFGLVAFGGAGPMHACALAAGLGIETVVIPPASGVLSAFGLLAADEKHDAVRTHRAALGDANPERVEKRYRDLEADVRSNARDPDSAVIRRRADLRYVGQSFELPVEVGDPFDPERVEARFHAAHAQTYGYRMDDPVDLVNLRVSATTPRRAPDLDRDAHGPARTGTRRAFFEDGQSADIPVFERSGLAVGRSIDGPAVIEGAESTAVVPPEWSAAVRSDGALVLTGGAR